ncbi:enoyl-CoA hydratase-related protein [Plasticicumulans acidivorans]|uniref:Enoyl-CoA hydratase n=1 Tax=Plasticicumulans acidivorans TaxID=886464 RepID=A0A317MQX3_9GAMM|nr:enoyl-CoA hydratase-related protein [Plasticicumulans acidivorans]PWV58862.1 enoyl-CoA hydratase [Plasticicumulans acidivorans]
MTDTVRLRRDGAVAIIELWRRDKKNALTADMYDALSAHIHAAEADPSVRVLLLHGGDDFTAGNDLKDFLANPPSGADSPVFRFLLALAACRKPLVAAVTGVAVGVGTTLLAHCDLVYAAEDARFLLPFVNLGLCPEAASSYLLPLLAGHVRAAEWLLLGEPFDARAALAGGLINEILPAADVLPRALARAQRLAAQPAAAVRVTRELLRAQRQPLVEEVIRREGAAFVERLASPEAAEAFAAFAEKRKPDFSRFN